MNADDNRLLASLIDSDGNIRIGPIPKGMPVNLLASFQPLAESKDPGEILRHYRDMLTALVELKQSVLTMPLKC